MYMPLLTAQFALHGGQTPVAVIIHDATDFWWAALTPCMADRPRPGKDHPG
jgi:hypothetical protein